jgi:predicted dehydrogenase
MLAAHPEIGYVAIAVPHHQQLSVVNQLAETSAKYNLNLAVAAEKPLGHSIAAAHEVFQTLKEAFRFGSVFTRFSYPPFGWGLEIISQGTLGNLRRIEDLISITGPAEIFEPYVHSPNPNDPELSRGNALLNGYHSASVLALLGGLPNSITAGIHNQALLQEVDDTAIVEATYPDWTGNFKCIWGITPETIIQVSTDINGETGNLTIEQWGNYRLKIASQNEQMKSFPQEDDFIAKHDAGSAALHTAILRYLSNPNESLPFTIARSLPIGLVAHAIVEMGYLSSARGGEVVTPEEVIEGIMSIEQLRTIASLAQLPQPQSA